MINFRYHVVSIVAIMLALAVGIALGSGPLDNAKNIVSKSGDQQKSAKTTGLASFDTAYARSTGPSVVKDKLKGQSVMLFALHDSQAAQIKGVREGLKAAGATIVGQVTLNAKLLDSTNRQFSEGVSQQSAKGVKGVATSGDGYKRIGSALGRAFLAKKSVKFDEDSSTIGSAFSEGKLITVDKLPAKRATAAVIVTGPRKSSKDDGQADILAQLAGAFDSQDLGTVVAGPSASSEDEGYLKVLRDSDVADKVSTIDVTDSAAGQLVTALVVAGDIAGDAGAYGTSRSADGPMPKTS